MTAAWRPRPLSMPAAPDACTALPWGPAPLCHRLHRLGFDLHLGPASPGSLCTACASEAPAAVPLGLRLSPGCARLRPGQIWMAECCWRRCRRSGTFCAAAARCCVHCRCSGCCWGGSCCAGSQPPCRRAVLAPPCTTLPAGGNCDAVTWRRMHAAA
jgi:hypothetical protein